MGHARVKKEPCVDHQSNMARDRSTPKNGVTRPAIYYRAVDRYGNPAPPGPVTDTADYAIARNNLDRAGCR